MMRYYKNILKKAAVAAFVLFSFAQAQAQVTGVRVGQNVFGGGNEAPVRRGTTVTIDQADAVIAGDVYGGGAKAEVDTIRLRVAAVEAADYITVTILAGTIQGDIYGGGLGQQAVPDDPSTDGVDESVPAIEANVYGPVFVSIGTEADGGEGKFGLNTSGTTVTGGQVFGANNLAGTPKDNIRVDIWSTWHGMGIANKECPSDADIETAGSLELLGHDATQFALQGVYGGGNKAGYTPVASKSTTVYIHNCENTVKMVYGGGRAADVGTSSVNTNVSITVEGGRLDTLFTGGDGHTKNGLGAYVPANIFGSAATLVKGGYHSAVFAGSNTSGTVSGTATVNISNEAPCATEQDETISSFFGAGNLADLGDSDHPVTIISTIACGAGSFDEVYGGANLADITGNVTLNVRGGTIGSVYGGSKGRLDDPLTLGVDETKAANITGNVEVNIYGGHIDNVFGGSNINGNITGTITVNINDQNATNCGLDLDYVYGASNLATYDPTTKTATTPVVNLINGTVNQDVFGGGFGDPVDATKGLVTSNPKVLMAPVSPNTFWVKGSVYGGGQMASVGVFGYTDGKPTSLSTANTGKTTVEITAGQVGENNMTMPTIRGMVFGAGKGVLPTANTPAEITRVEKLNFVDQTSVTIGGSALVTGSVYGGSQNGHVLHNTHVTIQDTCQIGLGAGKTRRYYEFEWTGENAANFTECAHWPYDPGHNGEPYDPFATGNPNPDGGHFYADNTTSSEGGSATAAVITDGVVTTDGVSDGRTFYGNVFGGGSGYLPYAPGEWLRTAGNVGGDAIVDITGGHILTSVYGGNEMTDVTGNAYVNMVGGTVGVPRTDADMIAHPVTCYVFGAGKGDPRVFFNQFTNVASAMVNIGGSARIFGSTFGGGEDGHVIGNVVTNIGGTVNIGGTFNETTGNFDDGTDYDYSNVIIGTTGTSGVDGNIFGGGRGYSALALTIGLIQGNCETNIMGGKIYGSVFGGGRSASVGTYQVLSNHGNYGLVQDCTPGLGDDKRTKTIDENAHNHGHIAVNITGGEIGRLLAPETPASAPNAGKLATSSFTIGDVFGGGKGLASERRLGLTKDVDVRISGNAKVYGSVYGGGEIASVGNPNETPVAGQYKTGLVTVSIYGNAQIGTAQNSSGEHGKGYVYGSGKGMAGSAYSAEAFVKYATVTIGARDSVTAATGSDTPRIWGSVFGGGEDGHVRKDTRVYIKAGTIGSPMVYNADNDLNELYFDPVTGASKAFVYRGNVYAGGRGIDKDGSDHYSVSAGSVFGDAYLYMTGGHVYHNIYGSGAMASVGSIVNGPGTFTGEVMNSTNNFDNGTFVGGTGRVTIDISGGIVGDDSDPEVVANKTNGLVDSTVYHPGRNNGRVFGAGRGLAVTIGNDAHAMEFVYSTNVTVRGNAQVLGAVFGGGENGHVKTDATVNIQGNCVIGAPLLYAECEVTANGAKGNAFRGNVFGGGRGVDPVDDVDGTSHKSFTAGRVYGNTTVNVSGGLIYRAVYGGGMLASVGNPTRSAEKNNNGTPGDTRDDYFTIEGWEFDEEHPNGVATVNITGGYIGNVTTADAPLESAETADADLVYGRPGRNNGAVFGSGAGFMATDVSSHEYKEMAYVYRSYVNISDTITAANPYPKHTHIRAAVFGGGENGHVWENATVNVSGGTIGNAPDGSNGGDFAFAGNVFGSGRGMNVTIEGGEDIVSTSAGWVRGNTTVNVWKEDGKTAPIICRDVYGGGNLGSVGNPNETIGSGEGYDKFGFKTGLATVNILGGNIYGNVYGSSRGGASILHEYADMSYVKNTIVNITGTGHIVADVHTDGDNGGFVYGGGNAGHVRRNTEVNVGGALTVRANTGLTTHTDVAIAAADANCTIGETLYGAGRGSELSGTSGQVNHSVTVNINSGATINGDVYGGGAIANSNVHDSRNSASSSLSCKEICTTTVNILGGTISGDVYGGGRGIKYVAGEYEAYDSDQKAEIEASCAAIVHGDVQVNIGHTSQYNNAAEGATILGNVFGCNNIAGSPKANVHVDVYSTAHTAGNGITSGDVYPSTLKNQHDDGEAGTAGDVLDTLDIQALSAPDQTALKAEARFALAEVYGGGNKADYLPASTSNTTGVTIHECEENTIKYVYGGGRAADIGSNTLAVSTTVLIEGGHIKQVFAGGDGHTQDGGGNYLAANIWGDATITIEGGLIEQAFGGSNTTGMVHGTASVNFSPVNTCGLMLDEAFGGGNRAEGGSTVVTIPCGFKGSKTIYGGANEAPITGDVTLNIEGGELTRVFGGSKNAPISGNVTVNVYGGSIDELFGGNDEGGNIGGKIEVNVDWGLNTCPDDMLLRYVYGGGYKAPYAPTLDGYGPVTDKAVTITNFTPVVNIIQATVDTAVFGGGFGVGTSSTSDAHIDANPKVVIGAYRVKDHEGNTIDAQPNNHVRIGRAKNELGRTLAGNVFGGGNAGPVNGSPKVVIQGSDTKVWHNVYGGGNAATVHGNPTIEIGANPKVSKPQFSLDGTTLTITNHEGADIYYTVGADPADPTTSSTKYSAPITVEGGQKVKAIAVKAATAADPTPTPSSVATFTVPNP